MTLGRGTKGNGSREGKKAGLSAFRLPGVESCDELPLLARRGGAKRRVWWFNFHEKDPKFARSASTPVNPEEISIAPSTRISLTQSANICLSRIGLCQHSV
jgi:hypothetical protein